MTGARTNAPPVFPVTGGRQRWWKPTDSPRLGLWRQRQVSPDRTDGWHSLDGSL